MWLGRKSDGKGAIEVFAFCLQESLDRALVGGMEITPSLAAAAFGKFPGKGLGKLEPPAELAAATTLSEAGCLFVRIVVPGEVFHLGRLSPCLSVCRCVEMRLSVEVCVHLSRWVFMRVCVSIYLSLWACVFISPSPRLLERLGEEGVGWAVSRIVDIPGSASFSALIL